MTEQSTYESRKDAHIKLAVDCTAATTNQFDEVAFVHHSLAGVDQRQVSTRTSFAGIQCPYPLYINAMTGGSAMAKRINGELAAAARDFQLPIATGSMSAFLADPSAADSYSIIRKVNPLGIVVANINANTSPIDAKRAVDLIGADAVQIHLNSVQEIVMPEGDRSFGHWSETISAMVDELELPVIVKEVGFGISNETFRTLSVLGVAAVDVAGRGGTDFAAIENRRRDRQDYDYLQGWGQSAAASLLEIGTRQGDPDLLASGGVRNPLDVIKALALGAHSVGVAGHFLRILLNDGLAELISVLESWLDQIVGMMTVLGANSVTALGATDIVVGGSLAERSIRRGVDLSAYARRSSATAQELFE